MAFQVRVLIIERDPIFRIGVGQVMAAADGMTLVGTAATLGEAVERGASETPDIVLVAVGGDGQGLGEVQLAANAFPLARVVVLAREEAAYPVEDVLGAGASAYISKCVSGAGLIESLRDVARGKRIVSPALSARGPAVPDPAERIDTLTDRERQVLASVGCGNTNKEVARELDLSEKTVKQYMSRIMDKLQVRNRVEAVIVARGYKPVPGSE